MNSHISMKYKKKVRLLVTNSCSKNCSYCHNEGMPKLPIVHLEPAKLEPFLPDIKKYSNRIVLSGGEPFEYEHIQELTELLTSFGFDLTLITANIDKEKLIDVGHRLKNIHYSLHDMRYFEYDCSILQWLNSSYPNIRVSLNVPFDNISSVRKNWCKIYDLSRKIGANIQLIRLFSYGIKSSCLWNERWQEMRKFLETRAKFLEGTERETRYITKDLIKIDLLDIPCLASGRDFSEGACLNNSDITIDPTLHLSVCRWTNSVVSLYKNGKPNFFDDAVRQATERGCKNCGYGEITNYLHSNKLDYYLNAPHYTWPNISNGLGSIYTKTFANDLSYYGKSGFVARLENDFSNYIGVKYSLAVNSGTTAVYLAFMALGLSVEDEVLIPVATFPTLVAALLTAGVKIRLCDVDSITGNISLDSLREHMAPSVKALLVTHLWGLPVNMQAVQEICREYNVYVIEDCSHAYGAEFRGQRVGSFGNISCFSLQANKTVYAGEGGLLVTSNNLFYERAIALSSSAERIFDCIKNVNYLKYWGTGLGLKLKLNPLGAPLALMALKNLEDVNQRRQLRVSVVERELVKSEVFILPKNYDELNNRVYYTYKLVLAEKYISQRDSVLQSLIHYGLEASTTSFIPIYKHELCSDPNIINGRERFLNAEKYYSRIISLPAFVYEPIELAEYYAEIIKHVSEHIL